MEPEPTRFGDLPATGVFALLNCYRAESTGSLDQPCGLDDGVDASVQLHLTIYTAHGSLFGSYDCHLHLSIKDQRVQYGLDVIHGQVHLQ